MLFPPYFEYVTGLEIFSSKQLISLAKIKKQTLSVIFLSAFQKVETNAWNAQNTLKRSSAK